MLSISSPDSPDSCVCIIAYDSTLANLTRRTDLIVWDEAPMMHKHNYNALDKLLQDLTHVQHMSP